MPNVLWVYKSVCKPNLIYLWTSWIIWWSDHMYIVYLKCMSDQVCEKKIKFYNQKKFSVDSLYVSFNKMQIKCGGRMSLLWEITNVSMC